MSGCVNIAAGAGATDSMSNPGGHTKATGIDSSAMPTSRRRRKVECSVRSRFETINAGRNDFRTAAASKEASSPEISCCGSILPDRKLHQNVQNQKIAGHPTANADDEPRKNDSRDRSADSRFRLSSRSGSGYTMPWLWTAQRNAESGGPLGNASCPHVHPDLWGTYHGKIDHSSEPSPGQHSQT